MIKNCVGKYITCTGIPISRKHWIVIDKCHMKTYKSALP